MRVSRPVTGGASAGTAGPAAATDWVRPRSSRPSATTWLTCRPAVWLVAERRFWASSDSPAARR